VIGPEPVDQEPGSIFRFLPEAVVSVKGGFSPYASTVNQVPVSICPVIQPVQVSSYCCLQVITELIEKQFTYKNLGCHRVCFVFKMHSLQLFYPEFVISAGFITVFSEDL